MYIERIESFVSGMVTMASACSEWIGRSYMEAYAFPNENFFQSFAEAFHLKYEKLDIIESDATPAELFTGLLGKDCKKAVDTLVYQTEKYAGKPLKVWTCAESGSYIIDKLGGPHGLSPFFFVEDVFFVQYEKMSFCFMVGNNE